MHANGTVTLNLEYRIKFGKDLLTTVLVIIVGQSYFMQFFLKLNSSILLLTNVQKSEPKIENLFVGCHYHLFISEYLTLYKPYSIRRMACSTLESFRYEESTPSVRTPACSTDQSHHQYGRGRAVHDCCKSAQWIVVLFIWENDVLQTVPL